MTSETKGKVHRILKKYVIINSVQRIISVPLSIVAAMLTAEIFSSATQGLLNKTITNSAILFFVIVGQTGLSTLIDWIKNKKLSKDMHQCHMILYNDFLSNPLHALFATTHGDNIERMNDDFSTFTNRYTSLLPDVMIAMISCVSYGGYILFNSVGAGLLLFAISVLQIIPPVIVKRYLQINYNKCRDIEAELTDATIEGYRGLATIKSFGLRKWWMNKIIDLHHRYYKIGNYSIYTATAETVINTFIGHVLKFGTYAIMGMLALISYISVPLAIQIITLSGSFFSSVNSLFGVIPRFSVSKLAVKRLTNWLAEEGSKDSNVIFCHANEDSIILKDLSFAYDNSDNTFSNLNYSFSAKQNYKIRGANGAGKTTLVNIISTLLLCDTGSLEFHSARMNWSREKQLPISYLFLLPQHDYKFNVTAKELYEMILPEKITVAKSFCFSFGLSEDQISNTLINDLSGGERKKVFLSLAFAVNPVFLLLDEPMNSLDDAGKNQLLQILMNRKNGTIIVSHTDELDIIIDKTIIISEGKIKNA